MKKIIALTLALVMATAVFGCTSGSKATTGV